MADCVRSSPPRLRKDLRDLGQVGVIQVNSGSVKRMRESEREWLTARETENARRRERERLHARE